jgi:hypothetical protein
LRERVEGEEKTERGARTRGSVDREWRVRRKVVCGHLSRAKSWIGRD